MAVDSLTLASAAALFATSIGGWWLGASLRAPARLPLRFAAMLLAALAVATALNIGTVAALLLLPLSSVALSLVALARFARPAGPLASTVALVAALACGLGALLSGHALPGLVLVMLAGLCVIAASLNAVAWTGALSGAALLACGLCFLQSGAGTGAMLFAAAALIGVSRQLLWSTSSAMRAGALP